MSGRGISSLGLPPRHYRVDLANCGFETLDASRAEDGYRAKKVREAAKRLSAELKQAMAAGTNFPWQSPDTVAEVEYLAAKLQLASTGADTPATLASSTYMRYLRIIIAGALWELIEKSGPENVKAFTIIPETWEIDDWELEHMCAHEDLMSGLRTAIYKMGARDATGWIIGFIHGEFEPTKEVYRLHMHGFACGGMIDVIDRLRLLPNYETKWLGNDGTRNPVYRRLRMSRVNPATLPQAVTYPLQSFWPSKALILSMDGKRVRSRRKNRIREPFHSDVLRWLDAYRIEDLTLMVGLRVTKDGLKQTKPVS